MFSPYPIETITNTGVASTALTLATFGFDGSDTIPHTYYVYIAAEGAIRYTTDGSTPTASYGIPLGAGSSVRVYGWHASQQLQVISQSGTVTVTAVCEWEPLEAARRMSFNGVPS